MSSRKNQKPPEAEAFCVQGAREIEASSHTLLIPTRFAVQAL